MKNNAKHKTKVTGSMLFEGSFIKKKNMLNVNESINHFQKGK